MKHLIKNFIPVILIFIIIVSSVVTFSAVTYYQYDGIEFTDYGKNQISLSGWDDRADVLAVPDSIGRDYFVSIDDYALRDDSVITSVDLSQAKHLTKIGTGAFSGCTSLENITIPEWTTELSNYLFQGCSSLKNVTIEAPIQKINTQMFNKCSSLESFIIPDSVTSIEKYAFGNCTSLSKIVIPKNVENISPTAFKDDTILTIYCYFGSAAQHYAIENNINYMLLDGVNLGDVNGDDNVDVNDATFIQSYLAELATLEGIYLHAADTNEDGEVDISDATAIQMHAAEFQTGHPIGRVMTK